MNPKPSDPQTLPCRLPQVLRFASHCCPHSSALDPQPAPPTSPTACASSSSNTTTTHLSVEECCEAVRLVQAAARMSWPTATAVPYGSLATATALPGASLNILLQGVLTEQVGGLAAQGRGRGESRFSAVGRACSSASSLPARNMSQQSAAGTCLQAGL